MEINIRDNWDRLSAATRQWLTDNPGCLILPRTLVATISKETDGITDSDQHGETALSQKGRDFIQAKAKAKANPGPETGPEHRFFHERGRQSRGRPFREKGDMPGVQR
jgi:hypothetical protein